MARKTTEKLIGTNCGRALIRLESLFPNRDAMADALGVSPYTVGLWFHKGRISRPGAIAAQQATGIPKEELRPDLAEEAWECRYPGRVAGTVPCRDELEHWILRELANQLGGVAALAESLGVRRESVNTWNSRGRIPARIMKSLLSMDIRADISSVLRFLLGIPDD